MKVDRRSTGANFECLIVEERSEPGGGGGPPSWPARHTTSNETDEWRESNKPRKRHKHKNEPGIGGAPLTPGAALNPPFCWRKSVTYDEIFNFF